MVFGVLIYKQQVVIFFGNDLKEIGSIEVIYVFLVCFLIWLFLEI